MAYAGGLGVSIGIGEESPVGTQVAPDRWYEWLGASPQFVPTYVDGQGIKVNQAYKRGSRTIITRKDINGDLTFEHPDRGFDSATGKGMGRWWKHALGAVSGPTVIGATTAFRTIITNGPKVGLGLSLQAGFPEAGTQTVKPYTWKGVKIVGWEFTCSDGSLAQVKFTLDGWDEDRATSLTSPTYPGAGQQLFGFADATIFTLGGTATTTSGLTTVASGVQVASIVRGITITGTTPLADARYGLGNAGVKKEQYDNGVATITGQLDAEFTSQAELYNLFANNTQTVLDLSFRHGDAGGGNPYELRFTLPAVKFKTGAVTPNGPDMLGTTIGFEAYDDGSGTNPVIQVLLVSKDTAI